MDPELVDRDAVIRRRYYVIGRSEELRRLQAELLAEWSKLDQVAAQKPAAGSDGKKLLNERMPYVVPRVQELKLELEVLFQEHKRLDAKLDDMKVG